MGFRIPKNSDVPMPTAQSCGFSLCATQNAMTPLSAFLLNLGLRPCTCACGIPRMRLRSQVSAGEQPGGMGQLQGLRATASTARTKIPAERSRGVVSFGIRAGGSGPVLDSGACGLGRACATPEPRRCTRPAQPTGSCPTNSSRIAESPPILSGSASELRVPTT